MSREEATFGRVEPTALQRIVVISPHLDDAVLGAAHLIDTYPGTTVMTVFAGSSPEYPVEPTPWDAAGGFVSGDDVAALRRKEDKSAVELLGGVPIWLDFVDHQYVAKDFRPKPSDIAPVLQDRIAELSPTAVFCPMGLANPDHVVTHEAALLARSALLEARHQLLWLCYEDAGYKHIPGILAWRIARLFKSGLWPTPAMVPIVADMDKKRRAIDLYTSQLAPLRADHDLEARLQANVPEQYWRLAPPPRGWEALTNA